MFSLIGQSDYFNNKSFGKNSLSNTNFLSSKGLLEDSDFKSFLETYETNHNDFFERLDNYSGFISTQQIESVDYEKFENHVFFDSAVEKVNYAFDNAINYFPYDSTRHEIDQYLKKLDGFSRFILNNKVEKSLNYYVNNTDQGIEIKDQKGFLFDDATVNAYYDNFNINNKSFSIEFWLYPKADTQTDGTLEIVAEKYVSNNGIILYLEDFNTTENTCNLSLEIKFNNSSIKNSILLKLDEFQHVNFSINYAIENDDVVIDLKRYLNGLEQKDKTSRISTSIIEFDDDYKNASLFIGYGQQQTINDKPTSSFNGYIDEFRFFINKIRSEDVITKEKNENIFAQKGLAIYLKFNEPGGQYINNNVILDYSGNKLHGIVKDFTDQESLTNVAVDFNRNSAVPGISTPLKYENINLNPVLFSSKSQSNKVELLENAADYDLVNPNAFWKLFPKNIFLEGSDFDNIDSIYINKDTVDSKNFLGTSKSINQEIIKLISIWARFFDQLKAYIDNMSEILNFNYDTINKNKKIDGMILPLALKQIGFDFKEMIRLPTREKLNGKNLTHKEVISDIQIRQIQNILWKRFILNSQDFITSKGTHRSINSIFNSFGLDASKFIKIKELTGQNYFNLDNQFILKKIEKKMLDFEKHGLNFEESKFNSSLFPKNKILFCTEVIEKSKLDFAGDFCIEYYFMFDKSKIEKFNNKQSLLRIDKVDNTDLNVSVNDKFIDIYFERSNRLREDGKIKFLVEGVIEEVESDISLNILNGTLYYLNFQKKYDEKLDKHVYNILIKNALELSYTSSSCSIIQHTDTNIAGGDKHQVIIGSYRYDTSEESGNFEGKITNFRMYNRGISGNDVRVKSKDINYTGPIRDINDLTSDDFLVVNNDYCIINNNASPVRDTNSSNFYEIQNFSNFNDNNKIKTYLAVGQNINSVNGFHVLDLIKKQTLINVQQNYEFDYPQDYNKVFINSHESEELKKEYKNFNLDNQEILNPDFLHHNDLRLYIDFSAVNFLNNDISKILNANEFFTQNISKSSYLFEENYIDLQKARNVYFQRLEKELDFSPLYQAYKYFDNILQDILVEAIPSKVNYLGFNFVYESHILERNKYQYKYRNSKLPASSSVSQSLYQNYNNSNIKYRSDDLSSIGQTKKNFIINSRS